MSNLFSDKRSDLRKEDQVVECSAWIRILQTLRADNDLLIRRLADAVSKSVDRAFIEEAEAFQIGMLSRETAIVLLRHEIKEQLGWLEDSVTEMAPHDHLVMKKEVEDMVADYEKMKSSFLVFVTGVS
ncbi:hypothetical protein DVR12_21465 [Chitinophaga silvatica]|uniref:Uncharacterized protein n=1 Tax=Chitinophaga silvatica TaxID=2282649 RepID=A0A3E1Y4W0_9BACT|nr:hypothetical protein [Chitinophaga silvatica]RFS19676.1 hypothetical protein DVR12_21465 [Chitinophaga silvatica]